MDGLFGVLERPVAGCEAFRARRARGGGDEVELGLTGLFGQDRHGADDGVDMMGFKDFDEVVCVIVVDLDNLLMGAGLPRKDDERN